MKYKYTLLCIVLHIAIIAACIYTLKFSDAKEQGDVFSIRNCIIILLIYTYMIAFEPRRLAFNNELENKKLSIALAAVVFTILFIRY